MRTSKTLPHLSKFQQLEFDQEVKTTTTTVAVTEQLDNEENNNNNKGQQKMSIRSQLQRNRQRNTAEANKTRTTHLKPSASLLNLKGLTFSEQIVPTLTVSMKAAADHQQYKPLTRSFRSMTSLQKECSFSVLESRGGDNGVTQI